MARQPAPDTRDRLVATAARLFNDNGVHAVGLQQVVDECGCGKNLLYREFASKDDLVVAWLERCGHDWTARIDAVTRPLADDPAAQIVAIVRATAEDAVAAGYRGCPMRNTHREFPDPEHPAHREAVDHLNMVRDRLVDLAVRAGARDPANLADRVTLIIDGLVTNGAILGPTGAAPAAVELADELVRAATRPWPT